MQSINNNNIFKAGQITTTISKKYPTYRDEPFQTVYRWLEGKAKDDDAEGLWRIYDKLYDFSEFVDKHPGGEFWLRVTKGTDITEAFETHHISKIPENLLSKYEIREAKHPRNSKLTFSEEGFYKTLKGRVREKIKDIDLKKFESRSILVSNIFLTLMITTVILTSITKSLTLAVLCGLLIVWNTVASHNFLHKKDNWRMMLFNFSFFSYREWRISHVMSHHLYTNSLTDLEMTWFEPYFVWLPDPKRKGLFQRYGSWIYGPFIYGFIFQQDIFKRIYHRVMFMDDLIPFIIPALMIAVNPFEVSSVLLLWTVIVVMSSFFYGVIGLNAAHHHPDIVHPGDGFQDNIDFGLYQIATVVDRADLKGSLAMALTNFGDHVLHHMFPTLDHAVLPLLYPTFYETCEEFNTTYRECPWLHHIIGQHKQLARVETKIYDPMKELET